MLDEAGHGVSSDILSHSDRSRPHADRRDREGRRYRSHPSFPERPLPKPKVAPTTTPASPATRLGTVENEDYFGAIVRLRERRARGTFEIVAGDRRAREPVRVRGLRHEGLADVEPRDDERAAGVPRGRSSPRVHHGVFRRSLPVSRQLRAGRCQPDRLRGPQGHRGSTSICHVGRGRPPAPRPASPRRSTT